MNNKYIQGYVTLCILSILGFIGIYILSNLGMNEYTNKDYDTYIQNYQVVIENAEIRSGRMFIQGWSCIEGEDNRYIDRKFVLMDSKNKIYEIKTEMQKRTDVTEYLNQGFDYDNSGMLGAVPTWKLKKDEVYKIGVLVKDAEEKEFVIMLDQEITL